MKMKAKGYSLLKDMSQFSFEECYAGLNLMLYTDRNFSEYMERKFRLKQYFEEGEFYMNPNERNFHLIDFIDAIIYLERAGLLFKDHKSSRFAILLQRIHRNWMCYGAL